MYQNYLPFHSQPSAERRIKRLLSELKLLATDPEVQSYFRYASSENIEELKRFCVYGYLLPQTEPYKYGSYKIRITVPGEFPFKPPIIHLLTYIYHPGIKNTRSEQIFCTCCYDLWSPTSHIHHLVKHCANIIDNPDNNENFYCTVHHEAKHLYRTNKAEYYRVALDMVKQNSCPQTNISIISLKFITKQTLRNLLSFNKEKINQLKLPDHLLQYLKSPFN